MNINKSQEIELKIHCWHKKMTQSTSMLLLLPKTKTIQNCCNKAQVKI